MHTDERLRVLLAAPETTGGIGRHVVALAGGLVRRGHAVTVCAPQHTLERLDVVAAGAAAVALPLGDLSAVRHRARMAALAREHDLTHAHGVRAGAQLALAGVTPLVVTWHNAPLGSRSRRALHTLLERVCARRASLVLGASDDLVVRARAAGAAHPRFVPVAAPEHAPVAAPARQPNDPPTVLSVARLHRQKRIDLLVTAAAEWPAGPDQPRFVVAGDGPLLDTLKEQAHISGAPVTFVGPTADVASLLAAADVVVLASDWEARPLVAQEALRAGVPLVATDVGGVRELVGEAALLVPPDDAGALAQAVRRVLTDQALRAELRRAGPARAAQWPTVEQMVDELETIYLGLRG